MFIFNWFDLYSGQGESMKDITGGKEGNVHGTSKPLLGSLDQRHVSLEQKPSTVKMEGNGNAKGSRQCIKRLEYDSLPQLLWRLP